MRCQKVPAQSNLRSVDKIEEIVAGAGPVALRNSTARIRYDLYLSRGHKVQEGIKITVDLFRREVVAGLRYGIEGMRWGGERKIRVSPHLGFGDSGAANIIPANAVLIFEVELLTVMPKHAASVGDITTNQPE